MLQMSHTGFVSSTEHPSDVITAALSMMTNGYKCALVFVTDILGGAVRARGAVMVVCENGNHAGYLSGGCIDADVIRQAQTAIKDSNFKKLRYGEGSPFYDLKLPCGGAIEVSICPNLAPAVLNAIIQTLENRKPIDIKLGTLGQVLVDTNTISNQPPNPIWNNESFCVRYHPKLKLRIAGRGADPLALYQISRSAGLPVTLWTPDDETLAAFGSNSKEICTHLKTPQRLPKNTDDQWTAFVLMFHDSLWETPLLQNALAGEAFYIGAVGSKKTHAKRVESLLECNTPKADIDRIHAPIGLVPSLRDASMLAISSLAEIISEFQKCHQ